MAIDALGPCITCSNGWRINGTMSFIHKYGFQLVPFAYQEMIENTNIFLFAQTNSEHIGLEISLTAADPEGRYPHQRWRQPASCSSPPPSGGWEQQPPHHHHSKNPWPSACWTSRQRQTPTGSSTGTPLTNIPGLTLIQASGGEYWTYEYEYWKIGTLSCTGVQSLSF